MKYFNGIILLLTSLIVGCDDGKPVPDSEKEKNIAPIIKSYEIKGKERCVGSYEYKKCMDEEERLASQTLEEKKEISIRLDAERNENLKKAIEYAKKNELDKINSLSSWIENVNDWNYLIGACVTNPEDGIEVCSAEYISRKDVMATAFEAYHHNKMSTYVVYGRQYRENVPMHLQKRDIAIEVPIIYKKMQEPFVIETYSSDTKGQCNFVKQFTLRESMLYEKTISQSGSCSESQRMIFDENKNKTKIRKIVR